MSRVRLCLFVALFTYLSQPCFAQGTSDWPRWMGAKMDGVWREQGILEKFPEGGPKVRWRMPIGPGYTGPSVAAGRVFVMDRTKDEAKGIGVENDIRKTGEISGGERIQCLDATTGKELWAHQYDCSYKIAYPTGPRCTPTVDDDRVYTLGAMGHLKCLLVSDGSVVWEKSLTELYGAKPPPWGYASHPLVDGPRLYVPVGGEGSGVVCFDKITGEEKWKALTVTDIAYAPLVIYEKDGERQLLSWNGDGVDSLNPETGERFWNVIFPEEKVQPAATTIATPRIIGNLFFVTEYYKGSLLLEIGSNPPNVKEVYRTYTNDPRNETSLNALMTTPVVKDGLIYGVDGDGEFRCVTVEKNELIWRDKKVFAKNPAMFGTLFVVENEGRYLMFSDEGELIIAKLSREGFQQIDRAKILEPTGAARGRKIVWSHPAFADGCMFARNDKEIVCVELTK
jgi:outer membrane protein assembly factor BamB